ncbi:MAG: hypothetical protein J7L73_03805 [Anaerolineales bacterium]|nr:hypothetical protein [Anaerolineales bacterium]
MAELPNRLLRSNTASQSDIMDISSKQSCIIVYFSFSQTLLILPYTHNKPTSETQEYKLNREY